MPYAKVLKCHPGTIWFFCQLPWLPSCAMPWCAIFQASKSTNPFSRIEPHTFIEPLKLPIPAYMGSTAKETSGNGWEASFASTSTKIRKLVLFTWETTVPLENNRAQKITPMSSFYYFTVLLLIFKWLHCAFCTSMVLYYTLKVSFKCIFILILGHMVCSFVTIETSWSCNKVIWEEASLWSLYF